MDLHFAYAALVNDLPKTYYKKLNKHTDGLEIPAYIKQVDRAYMERKSHRAVVMMGYEADVPV